jgi:archaellum component FlaG (FlaF/FlaG flagellin family)
MKRTRYCIVFLLLLSICSSGIVAADVSGMTGDPNPYPTPEISPNGSIWVSSIPSNATIYLGGVQEGLTNRLISNVTPGEYNLTLKKSGYQSTTLMVEVHERENKVLSPIILTPSGEPVGNTGSVYVSSSPTNTTIYIDGVMKGMTNLLVTNIPAGNHTLKLSKTGYQTYTTTIKVIAGQDKVLSPIILTPGGEPVNNTGSVFISSSPTNATIYIDGVMKGMTNLLVQNITAGTHTLKLSKAGYQNYTAAIEVIAGQDKVLSPIILTPGGEPVNNTGSVYVSSSPTNATIYIDGVMKGMTNLLVQNITAGSHNLTLKKTGYQSKTQTVEVKAGVDTVLAPIILTPGGGPVNNTGSVYVSSSPTNATIYIDGVMKGMTNSLVTNIAAGNRTLKLSKTGYQTYTTTVKVIAGQDKVLSPIILTPGGEPVNNTGSVYVSSSPTNATIYIDGVMKGMTNLLVQNITAGTHTLKLSKAGYQNYTAAIEVIAGQDKVLSPIILTPGGEPVNNTGSVYVSSSPTNATIYIDGVIKGLTNSLVTTIPAGNRTLKLSKTGFQTYTTTIEVIAGQEKVLSPIILTPGGGPVNNTGSVYVASIPTNATILIDSAVKGVTNQIVSGIPAGTHNLTLTKVGYQATTIWVDIVAGVNKILNIITMSPV